MADIGGPTGCVQHLYGGTRARDEQSQTGSGQARASPSPLSQWSQFPIASLPSACCPHPIDSLTADGLIPNSLATEADKNKIQFILLISKLKIK